jgi:hypothetical protein
MDPAMVELAMKMAEKMTETMMQSMMRMHFQTLSTSPAVAPSAAAPLRGAASAPLEDSDKLVWFHSHAHKLAATV